MMHFSKIMHYINQILINNPLKDKMGLLIWSHQIHFAIHNNKC